MPNFGSIKTEKVSLPYRDRKEKYIKVSYDDPVLQGYEVFVVEDTKNNDNFKDEGSRLTTIIARFPRCILPEVNTHRVFSRNSASSRARSVRVTINDVMSSPYVPLFTKNRKGMSGEFLEEEDYKKAKDVWLEARDEAVRHMLGLLVDLPADMSNWEEVIEFYYDKVYKAGRPDSSALSVHKQNANRLLEPFMWHEALITSDKWDNFLKLRTDLDHAQPEIYALALLVRRALEVSQPKKSWIHLPFAYELPEQPESLMDIKNLMMLSATNCAQISYKDKSRATQDSATVRLGERLLELMHLSPFEHIAVAKDAYDDYVSRGDQPELGDWSLSNFSHNWVQLRAILTKENGEWKDVTP